MKAVYVAIAFGVALLLLSSYVCCVAVEAYYESVERKEYYEKNKREDPFGVAKIIYGTSAEVSRLIAIIQAEFALLASSIIALAYSLRR